MSDRLFTILFSLVAELLTPTGGTIRSKACKVRVEEVLISKMNRLPSYSWRNASDEFRPKEVKATASGCPKTLSPEKGVLRFLRPVLAICVRDRSLSDEVFDLDQTAFPKTSYPLTSLDYDIRNAPVELYLPTFRRKRAESPNVNSNHRSVSGPLPSE